MTLSPLQVKYYLAIAVFAALLVFELVTRLDDRHKIRSGLAEDLRKSDRGAMKHNAVQYPKWRIWTEGLLIIAAGLCMVLAMWSMSEYDRYGAFYDASWRDPSVEDHFEFESAGNKVLEAAWKADPDAYDWAGTRVVLVKLGCEDCEHVAETIHQLEADGYVTVFSRSELGQAYAEKYGISYVPSAIVGNMVVQLRSGASIIPGDDGFDQDAGKTDGEIARDILDGLTGGYDPASDPDYTKYGTKAAIEAAEEEARRQQEESAAGAGEP